MEWSYNENRMLSTIELIENPDRHKNCYMCRYFCCFWKKKTRQ